jgi:predicted flap endonuclease-1-like 5' DNA nuclease
MEAWNKGSEFSILFTRLKMNYMLILDINPLSKPVAISEMLILILLAVVIGWWLGQRIIQSKINAVREALAIQEHELGDCNQANAQKLSIAQKGMDTRDDLKIIEGVGPKIEHLLNMGGIFTFDQLINTKPTRIVEILQNAGSRFQMHDPTTWIEQARLARDHKWDELQIFQDKLDGGRIV